APSLGEPAKQDGPAAPWGTPARGKSCHRRSNYCGGGFLPPLTWILTTSPFLTPFSGSSSLSEVVMITLAPAFSFSRPPSKSLVPSLPVTHLAFSGTLIVTSFSLSPSLVVTTNVFSLGSVDLTLPLISPATSVNVKASRATNASATKRIMGGVSLYDSLTTKNHTHGTAP